ncbi:maleylpyruvate isomerase family mycothiol-dependent enzyme [Geodermatophilus sp. SYSU D00758]
MSRPRVRMLPEVAAQRRALADLLDDLHVREWAVRSLCPAWTVQEVLAHLSLSTRQSTAATLLRVVRAGGSFERADARWAQERAAAFPPAALVAQLRETADADRRLGISSPWDPLVDVLVHAQDVVRPLGRAFPTPPDLAVAGLRHVWRDVFYGRPERRFRGLRLVATDGDWDAGEGHEVRGCAGDLLLLATGRPLAAVEVHGPGVRRVGARLGP